MQNVITNDWKQDKANTHSCNCPKSEFCDPHHGHIVTGDLRVIEHRKLRSIMSKGPTYRERSNIHRPEFLKDVKSGLNSCVLKWAQSEKVDVKLLDGWKYKVFDDIKARVQKLKKIGAKHARHKSIMHSQSVKTYLKKLHDNFVLVPTDKASNNIAVVCKNFYIQKSIEEL